MAEECWDCKWNCNSAKSTVRLPFLLSVCSISWDLRGGPKSNILKGAFEPKTFTLTMQSFKLKKYAAMKIPLMLQSDYMLRIEWIFQKKVKCFFFFFFYQKVSMDIAHVQPERKGLMVNLKRIQPSTMLCLFILEEMSSGNCKNMMLATSWQTQSLELAETSICMRPHAWIVTLLKMRAYFVTEGTATVW